MKTLSLLKKGLKFRPVIFVKENCYILVKNVVKSKDPEITAISLMCKTLKIAKKCNLVTISESNKDNLKKFTENNQTVKDWFETLTKTNFQNINSVHH